MYAGFWRRVFACILDLIIFSIVWGCILFPFDGKILSPLAFALLCLVFLTLWFFYFVYSEASFWQATLGKRIVGIKVVDMHGYRISILRSAGRNVSIALSCITFCIGFLMCLWTKREQCLHDMTSGCLIVTKDVQPSPEFPPTQPPLIMWFCLIIIPIVWLAWMSIPFRMAYLMNENFNELMTSQSFPVQRSNRPTTPKPTSFKEAIEQGDGQSITHYLQNGADPNQKTEDGTPYLLLAKDAKALALLLQAGADANAKDAKGNTALMAAAQDGNAEKVDMLLKKGANVNARTLQYGTTPLMFTCMHPFVKRDTYQYMKPKLIQAARTAERLLQAGANVNATDFELQTALMLCSFWGNDQVVNVLLKSNASHAIVDKDGDTPLIIAATYNHPNVVAALLNARVPLNVSNKKGDTALIKAAFNGNTEIVRMLLAAGAAPGLKNKKGYTALEWAAIEGHKDIVDLLVQAGEKPFW